MDGLGKETEKIRSRTEPSQSKLKGWERAARMGLEAKGRCRLNMEKNKHVKC
jgi:hypothetical protein